MWSRFTERARRVTFFAQEEAGRMGQNEVSAEHFLIATVRENDSVAARILDRMGISLGRIRSEVERRVTRRDGRLKQDMQLAESGKRVVNYAYLEANQLGHKYIGTEHLLLGLIREGLAEPGEITGMVLGKLGVDQERARREVTALHAPNNFKVDQPADEVIIPSHSAPASAASAMSQASAILFETEFRRLSPEQQTALQNEGLPVGQLPPILQTLIKVFARPALAENNVIPSPTQSVRLLLAPANEGTSYTISTSVTLIANLLAQDELDKEAE